LSRQKILIIAAVAALASTGAIGQSDSLIQVRLVEGKWEGMATGEPGKGVSAREYRFDLNGRFLSARNNFLHVVSGPPHRRRRAHWRRSGLIRDVPAAGPKRGYHGFTLWMPDMLNWGDQPDFAAAMAPRPLMLWAPTEDVAMPKQAVDRFVEIARPAYERAGAKDALVVYQRPGIHELNFEAFDAMNKFFDAHLKNDFRSAAIGTKSKDAAR